MCNVSDKIIFCSCAVPYPERLRHYWILHRLGNEKEQFTMGMPYFPDENLYRFDHQVNKQVLEKRSNDLDAFDFDIIFNSNDRFEIVLNSHLHALEQRVTYYFNFINGKWLIDQNDCYFETMNNFDEVKFGKFKKLKS